MEKVKLWAVLPWPMLAEENQKYEGEEKVGFLAGMLAVSVWETRGGGARMLNPSAARTAVPATLAKKKHATTAVLNCLHRFRKEDSIHTSSGSC